jgi:glycosyltransferase involved in cell wall biosynthesis
MKISIITATFNSERHLERCLESIHSQGGELDHVVIDGGSTDGTLAILERYRGKFSHFVSEPDRGISDAFNKGLRLCSGDVIGIVSSDDYLLPGALDKIRQDWAERGACDVVFGNVIFLDSPEGVIVRPDASLKSIWSRQPLKHAAMFVARSTYARLGGYSCDWRCAMDYELTLRFYVRGCSFRYLDANLAAVRPGGFSYKNLGRTMKEVCEIAEQYGASVVKTRPLLLAKLVRVYVRQVLISSPCFAPLLRLYRSRNPRFSLRRS